MTDQDLERLLTDLESDLVERTSASRDRDKLREAICAFANDLPDHRSPGVLLIGVNDDGSCSNLSVTDQLLRDLGDLRTDGNTVPFPSMTVQKRVVAGCELAVILVQPSESPPVRCRGRVWVRVGPRRAIATPEEERRLTEKRRAGTLPYDVHPVQTAQLADLDLDLFRSTYLPAAVAPDVIAQNERKLEEQLASLRLTTATAPWTPTVLGMLTVGRDPQAFFPGAYVQFLRIDGTELTDPIKDQKDIRGALADLLTVLDETLRVNISVSTSVVQAPTELRAPDYPLAALQQLARNAILHRSYEGTNAPVRIYWYSDRIEIQSPGGPFGQVTRRNFGSGVTDYRNPHLAEAMRNLGYVQKFGLGLPIARRELESNANPELELQVEDSSVLAIVRRRLS
jgi:ATP-dependent DNA helicase RecG